LANGFQIGPFVHSRKIAFFAERVEFGMQFLQCFSIFSALLAIQNPSNGYPCCFVPSNHHQKKLIPNFFIAQRLVLFVPGFDEQIQNIIASACFASCLNERIQVVLHGPLTATKKA
jgi:hypothetical protein